MTWSIGLQAAGVSSMKASVSRHSMPTIASLRSSSVNCRRAAEREYSRPAPCGDDMSDTALPRPSTTHDAVPYRAVTTATNDITPCVNNATRYKMNS